MSPQPKQSVQKILRLTGNMSLLATLSTDPPTLHNSSQKISQLTGLDFTPKGLEADDDAANVFTAETASIHSSESLEVDALSVDPAESTFRSSYIETVDEVYTQLTAPKYSTPPTPFRDRRSYSEPLVRDALRLSGFTAADSLVARLPTKDKRLTEQRESWFRDHDDDVESRDASSSDGYSDVVELNHTVDKRYCQPIFPLARSGPKQAFNNSSPALGGSSPSPPPPSPPPRSARRVAHALKLPDDMAFAGYKGNFVPAMEMDRHQSATLPPPSPSLFSTEGSRRQEGLSERRLTTKGRGSLQLSLSSLSPSTPKGGRWAHPRVPDSPDLSADEAGASSPRYPLLTKILISGTASGRYVAKNSDCHLYNHSISPHSAQPERGGASFPAAISMSPKKSSKKETQQPTSTYSPDTPESGITTFAAAASATKQRATDNAVVTTPPAVNTIITPVTYIASTAAGGARSPGGLGSPTFQDGEVGSPKGLWKRALGHAKSKTGIKSSKADKKRNK